MNFKKYINHKIMSVILLSFITGIHSGFVKFALTLWLKSQEVHIIYLGLINLIFLPFSLKILWMPFLESTQNPILQYSYRKSWLIILEGIIIFLIANLFFISTFISFSQMSFYKFILLSVYLFILTSVIATKEAMAIAYQMEVIKRKHWGSNEGTISAFFNIGFWIGGVLLFLASDFIEWKSLFIILTIILLIFFVIQLFIVDSVTYTKSKHCKESFYEKFIHPYKDLLKRNKEILTYLILFIALYRLQDRLLMSFSNYFFIDLGFNNFELCISKTLGIFSMIFGGVLGSYSIKKIGYKKTLMIGMILHAISCSLFLLQSIVEKSHMLFYFLFISEKFMRGFEGNVFFVYQMLFCSKYYFAAQFSILIALDKGVGSILSSICGIFITYFGWSAFFIFSFIGTLPSLWLLKKLPEK